MKRILVIVVLALLTMAGCTKESSPIPTEQKILTEEPEIDLQQLHIDSDAFHYVVGWLSDEEIVYVEKNETTYALKSFNIVSNENRTIYVEQSIMTNVFIHPTKSYLLVHSSADLSSGTVKIMTPEGVVENEITIESSELEIVWNDVNPLHMLVTAFYDDWSFDTFFFDYSTDKLQVLPIDDPFPRWFGEDAFITVYDEEIVAYKLLTAVETIVVERPLIVSDTYEDAFLAMWETAEGSIRYDISSSLKDTLLEGSIPFLSDAEGLLISNVEWLTPTDLLFIQSRVGETSRLVKLSEGGVEVLIEDVRYDALLCSPNGQSCLVGHEFEKIMNIDTLEEHGWLIQEES